MKAHFSLVNPRNNWLKKVGRRRVAIYHIFLICVLTVLSLFLPKGYSHLFVYAYVSIFMSLLAFSILSEMKFMHDLSFEKSGVLILKPDELTIEKNGVIKHFKLDQLKITLHYDFIRGKTEFFKGDKQDGISKLQFEENEFYFLIDSYSQNDSLRDIIIEWNQRDVTLTEVCAVTGSKLVQLKRRTFFKN